MLHLRWVVVGRNAFCKGKVSKVGKNVGMDAQGVLGWLAMYMTEAADQGLRLISLLVRYAPNYWPS